MEKDKRNEEGKKRRQNQIKKQNKIKLQILLLTIVIVAINQIDKEESNQ